LRMQRGNRDREQKSENPAAHLMEF
jgi:hypothetical protein